jgi:hypothetical protein
MTDVVLDASNPTSRTFHVEQPAIAEKPCLRQSPSAKDADCRPSELPAGMAPSSVPGC